MAQPTQNMVAAFLDLGLFMADGIDATKTLCDSTIGNVCDAEEVKIFKRPWLKGTCAAQKTKRFGCVEWENVIENGKELLVLPGRFCNGVIIRHPEDLLSLMTEQSEQENGGVDHPEKLLGDFRCHVAIAAFLECGH